MMKCISVRWSQSIWPKKDLTSCSSMLLPMAFTNLGAGGSVVMFDGDAADADTLVYNGTAALCSRPGCPRVRSMPANGCSAFEREPGADDDPDVVPASATVVRYDLTARPRSPANGR